MSVQYRVVFGKKDEVVEGPDDADVVVTTARRRRRRGFDPTVAYMQGKLKAAGHTGRVVRGAAQRRGDAPAISRLASRP